MLKFCFHSLLALGFLVSNALAQPAVTALAPVTRAPLAGEIGAPLQSGDLKGQLAYASDQPLGGALKTRGFLALYSTLTEGKTPAPVVVYPLQIAGEGVPFDPQFAPDGQTVLFKIGALDGAYHLFALDLQSGVVRLAVKRELSLRRVIFSPDGKYLAYIAGQSGDALQPLRLLVNEWRSDREKLIVRNDGTFNGFSWSAPHTLFFTALPNAPRAHPGTDHKGEVAVLEGVVNQKVPTVARPNIYQAAPENGEVRLTMLEANRPAPSPDGKWVAFYGMETPTNAWKLIPEWQLRPSYVALSVMRADGLGRMALNVESKTYPALFWRADNRHLVAAQTIPVLNSSLEVRLWDTENGHFERKGQFLAPALGVKANAAGDFPMRALGLTRDGQSLLIMAQSAPENWEFAPEADLPGGPTVLMSLSLASAQLQTLTRLARSTGLDWWQAP